MGVYGNDNYRSLPGKAEAIRTTVLPITPLIHRAVVPIIRDYRDGSMKFSNKLSIYYVFSFEY